MLRLAIVVIYIICCWKWGDWKRWREFYPTFLYVIIGDLSYNFIFYERTLWKYQGLISHTFSDYLVAGIVFPCTIILFFTHYPEKLWKQALYILFWAGINTFVEYISYKAGYFTYANGWNVLWSIGLLYIAFIMVRMHYKHPLVVWPISVVLALITMTIFNIPFYGLK